MAGVYDHTIIHVYFLHFAASWRRETSAHRLPAWLSLIRANRNINRRTIDVGPAIRPDHLAENMPNFREVDTWRSTLKRGNDHNNYIAHC